MIDDAFSKKIIAVENGWPAVHHSSRKRKKPQEEVASGCKSARCSFPYTHLQFGNAYKVLDGKLSRFKIGWIETEDFIIKGCFKVVNSHSTLELDLRKKSHVFYKETSRIGQAIQVLKVSKCFSETRLNLDNLWFPIQSAVASKRTFVLEAWICRLAVLAKQSNESFFSLAQDYIERLVSCNHLSI